ncbi:MAG: hypothetical protein AB1439_08070 [candidate division FCPU426 bacterium]
MDAYQQGLRELLQKGRLSPLDVKEGMIAAYVLVSRLNQSQGNPSVGLQQKPEGLYGHLKGFMGAIFWERGYDFDNPSLEQLAEVKIMTDGMAQIYAMSEELQNILNNLMDYIMARARGAAATLMPEVADMLGISAESPAAEPAERELMPWEEPDQPPESGPAPPQEAEPAAWEEQAPAADEPASSEAASEPEPVAQERESAPSGQSESEASPETEPAWEPTIAAETPEPAAEVQSPAGAEPVFPWESTFSGSEAPLEAPVATPNETPFPAAFETAAEAPAEETQTESPSEGSFSSPSEPPAEVPFLTETSPNAAWNEQEFALISETDAPGQPEPEAPPAGGLGSDWNFDVLTNEPAGESAGEPEPQLEEVPPQTETPPPKRPRGRPRKTPAPAAATAEAEAAPVKKRRGRKPKLVLPEGMELPQPRRRRKPKQKALKIDLAAVQVPDDFMTEGADTEAPEMPATQEQELETGVQPEDAEPMHESLSDEQLLSDITNQWQPEPVAFSPYESAAGAETGPASSETTESEPSWSLAAELEPGLEREAAPAWDNAASAEPVQTYGVQDDAATAVELSVMPEASEPESEPEAEAEAGSESEPEAAGQTAESEWSPEASPSSWRELGGTEMEPEKIASAFSQSAPEEPEREPMAAEPPRKRGGGAAGFVMLVLGLLLGAGGSYYWFGIHESGALKTQLAEAKKSVETQQQQLTQAQEQAKNLSTVLNTQREASKQPPAKPKAFKVGKGAVLFWNETALMRKYNVYHAKGTAKEWTKVNSEPLTENLLQLKQVDKGVHRYAVAALDQDGQETSRSEELSLKFPLK